MNKPILKDESMKVTKALPNGAASVSSDPIDLGGGTGGDRNLGHIEFLLTAPALNVTQQPNSKTLIYKAEHSDDNSSYSTLYDNLITQTGAGGAGAAAATKRFAPPSDCKRYVRITATGSASGDASGVSLELALVT